MRKNAGFQRKQQPRYAELESRRIPNCFGNTYASRSAARFAHLGRARAHISSDSYGTNWAGQQLPHSH